MAKQTKYQRDKARWLRQFKKDLERELGVKVSRQVWAGYVELGLGYAKQGRTPQEAAKLARRRKNPGAVWHHKKLKEAEKEMDGMLGEGYSEGFDTAFGEWSAHKESRSAALRGVRNPLMMLMENPERRTRPDNVRPWYWECRECGFVTPRSPRTRASDLGPCPRCGKESWKRGTRAKSNPKDPGFWKRQEEWYRGEQAKAFRKHKRYYGLDSPDDIEITEEGDVYIHAGGAYPAIVRRAAKPFSGNPGRRRRRNPRGGRMRANPGAMPDVGLIMAYEDGSLGADETLKLFSDLVKSGMAWRLQGHYGRTASRLIEAGYLSSDGKILRDIEE